MRFVAVIVSTVLLLAAGAAQAGFDINMVDKKNPDLFAGFDFTTFGVTFALIEVDCPDIFAVAVMTAAQKNQVTINKIQAQQKTNKKELEFPTFELELPLSGYVGDLDVTTKAKMQVQATAKGKGKAKVDLDLGKAGINMAPLPNADDAIAYSTATQNKACQGVKTDKKFKKFKATLKGDLLVM